VVECLLSKCRGPEFKLQYHQKEKKRRESIDLRRNVTL
jgi:hypothetical protein